MSEWTHVYNSLSNDDTAALKKLDAAGIKSEIVAQCLRIHRAVMDGSLDRPTVEDAFARIAVVNKSNEPDATVVPDKPATVTPAPFFATPTPAPVTPAPTHPTA